MARSDIKSKKDKKKVADDAIETVHIQKETWQGILAVLFFVLTIFFVLSSPDIWGGTGKAGIAGYYSFEAFSFLFGKGYYLIPVLFLILSISFFKSLRKKLALTHTIGGILFFLSSLAIVDIIFPTTGGVIGGFVSKPMVTLFATPASLVILLACVVISFLVMFDTPLRLPSISNMFGKKSEDNNPDDDLIITKTNQPEAIPEIKNDAEKMEEKPGPIKKMFNTETQKEDFVMNNFSLTGKEFTPPPLSLLEKDKGRPGVGDIKANSNIIKRTLANFGINVEMDEISIGPSITRYALKPAEGVKLSRIVGLQNDLSLALAAHPIRIEAPIPGKSLVGIEIPNSVKTTVGLGSLLGSPDFQNSEKPLLICLGKGISGMSYFSNLAKAPHLLIAGSTGSGKSVTIHAIITSLLYRNSPDNLKFIMVDPKRVELTLYNKIPHLLTPVVTDAKKTILALKWAAKEMDRRYDVLQAESLQNIESYHKNIVEPEMKKMRNKSGKTDGETKQIETMPYIVVVIDELADIMQAYPRELESAIVRLAQMSRAVGIHLILSTQRPSVNVITGLIKANIPSRIALQVSSQIDSRTILDMSGAEKLLGAGDMLYLGGEMSQPQRIQSAYISESEVKSVAKYLAESYQNEIPNEIDLSGKTNGSNEGTFAGKSIFEADLSDDKLEDDELYEDAKQTVIAAGKASTSYLQRKLGVGYARAAKLIDMLEERGVVGPGSGAKPREVLGVSGETTTDDISADVSASENQI